MSTVAQPVDHAQAGAAPPLRFITAASLFDGHDAAINIIRRLLQAHGAEVVHLGHNRAVAEIVRAALQEDADGIAVSSYQGGHMEYFKYMVDMLRDAGAEHVRIVVGGGGTIAPHEIDELEAYGVEKVYSPGDGMRMGLDGMIDDVFARIRAWHRPPFQPGRPKPGDHQQLGRTISLLEQDEAAGDRALDGLRRAWRESSNRPPVLGITGTGGAGKSSLTDELLNRFRQAYPDLDIAVLAVDPTRRRTGGALLGDRIRMNTLADERIFMRSIATRRAHAATSAILSDTIQFLKSCGFGLIIVETAGIGQSDSEVVDLVDFPVYVMTSEYGAASQLEKIDMLDFAEVVVLNKFEKRGADDALRDVRKQWKRNRVAFKIPDDEVPVYPTIASQFNDPGVNRLFAALVARMVAKLDLDPTAWRTELALPVEGSGREALIPPKRVRYLAEISEQGRGVHRAIDARAEAASTAYGCWLAMKALGDAALPAAFERVAIPSESRRKGAAPTKGADPIVGGLHAAYNDALEAIGSEGLRLLQEWPQLKESVRSETYSYTVRDREITGDNYSESLSHLKIPKIAVPKSRDWGDLLRFLMEEHLPGHYPYTAGVYPYRRLAEDPARMFAGEGTPERTNRRFHYVAAGQPATRLSTAFDSVTLYGEDPDERPDIYGRIGNSGVSIATVDDMKKLYSGFDLCAPTTSVSMTINGPAPIILAMFMNAAIDQQVERHLRDGGTSPSPIGDGPRYSGELPRGSDGSGLGLLGEPGDRAVDAETYARLKREALSQVRGTVQADILKEDQAQNTCIFSTDFALRMMGDVQSYFSTNGVRNFYSVSISGYHIAEAGANPISQLAFTLANGFTIVEYYLARGMDIDSFAPNLSFFFSNGMDPEYAVIGRVARRIWARAMRERYGAGPRSQMLKYHIQTSGRSLHAQEIQFNDIRTTLQALYALYDNCNSLHTNAYDEAITTPTEESVRRALAIQLIINRELGLNKNENSLQGAFVIEELTDLVEDAVYQEFERISERGGVLGAMETMYQRGKIQEESLHYEALKHDGRLPIVGVNTFQPHDVVEEGGAVELIRSTEDEKRQQIDNIRAFHARHAAEAPAALARLQRVARNGGNVFEELLETVKVCSLGQISDALYAVGGRYRRNM